MNNKNLIGMMIHLSFQNIHRFLHFVRGSHTTQMPALMLKGYACTSGWFVALLHFFLSAFSDACFFKFLSISLQNYKWRHFCGMWVHVGCGLRNCPNLTELSLISIVRVFSWINKNWYSNPDNFPHAHAASRAQTNNETVLNTYDNQYCLCFPKHNPTIGSMLI